MFRDRLLRGSFKGVRYNFEDSTTSDGGNNIFHTYVNSNDVDVELVGRDPRSFRMKIYIFGDEVANYKGAREALEGVLREGAIGKLVHPLHGEFEAAVDGKYSLNETVGRLGKAEYSVKFNVINKQAFRRRFVPTPQKLYQQGDLLAQSKRDQFEEEYGFSTIDAIKQAQFLVKGVAFEFQKATKLINDPVKAGEFVGQLLGFEKGLFTTSADLARDIYGLYSSANAFIDRAEDRFNFFKGLFGYGDDEPEIPQTTRAKVEQAKNQVLERTFIQSSALVFATAAATEIEYSTDVELQTNNTTIQLQYTKVLEDEGTTNTQYRELQTIRVDFTEIVKELTLSVSRIIEIEVNNIGLTTLIYKYYGITESADNYNEIYQLIISLNNLEETGGLSGTLKIITEENVA